MTSAAPSTCSNGIPGVSTGNVCCKENCGLCGGEGCGAVDGTNGASDCCPDTIIEESGGVFCGDADAPCVMEGFTPSPVNPASEGTAAPVGEKERENDKRGVFVLRGEGGGGMLWFCWLERCRRWSLVWSCGALFLGGEVRVHCPVAAARASG